MREAKVIGAEEKIGSKIHLSIQINSPHNSHNQLPRKQTSDMASASTTWSMSCLKSALPSIQPISSSSLRFSCGPSPSRLRICKPKSSSRLLHSFVGLAPLHQLLSLSSPGALFITIIQIYIQVFKSHFYPLL